MATKLEHSVFILCAGDNNRFGGIPKSTLMFGTEMVISRIARQCMERSVMPTVVTRNLEIWHAAGRKLPLLIPSVFEKTCDTVASTIATWGIKRTTILLGDVIYTRKAIDRILNDQADVSFFGNNYEIFAVGFSENAYKIVADAIEIAREHKLGKLHQFYRAFSRFGLDDMPEKHSDCFVSIDDNTSDFDTPQRFAELHYKLVSMRLLDDLPGEQQKRINQEKTQSKKATQERRTQGWKEEGQGQQ